MVGEHGSRSSEARWAALERLAVTDLSAGAATHRWVAHDLTPSDHVPFIGRVAPGAERRWVATGFQKWGIATTYVAADLLARRAARARPVRGRRCSTRAGWPPASPPSCVRDGLRAARHLVVDRLVDLRPGRERRPRCTHLGCVLAFDEAEQSWDCPCHGSRYEADGSVISGPATRDLPKPHRRAAMKWLRRRRWGTAEGRARHQEDRCRITSKSHPRTAPSTTGSARTWRDDQELADELVAEEDGDLDAAEERFQEEAKGRDTYEAGHPRPS